MGRYLLLNFWQLSVPIFITHSLLQRINNSWIFNKNTATRVPLFASGQSRETLFFDNENLCFDRQIWKIRVYESWVTKFEMLNYITVSCFLQPQANDCDWYVLVVYTVNKDNNCLQVQCS